jgi:pSer/pThr/pTyr-binding forkhead associated (FHA) protein
MTLVLRSEDGWEGEIPEGGSAVVGRRAQFVDLCLPEVTVASRHARVFAQQGEWYIEDLRSHCGIFVNQRRIEGAHTLRAGDVVRLGRVNLTVDTR